jgi:hypothetical protein
MSSSLIRWMIVIGVVAGIAYPITREMKARAAVEHMMINTLDANDLAALKNWPGSVESFIPVLRERCMSTHNRDAEACARYSLAGN